MKINRLDVMALTLGKNVKETPQGFLVIPAYTARTGIQQYKMDDGSVVKEFRPEEEVFSDVSMASLRTAAVTDGHPKVMVSPENAHELMLGHTDGVIQKIEDGEEKFLATNLIITHKKAIDAIKAGKAELSNGYNVDLDFTPGEYKGQRYDAVQRNIVNNHIAIVWKARGGEKVRLRLDSDQAVLDNDNWETEKMKVKLGDKEFEVSDEFGAAFNAFMKGNKEKEEKQKKDSEDAEKNLKEENTKLQAKVDSLESDLAKAKSEKMDEEKIKKSVKERIAVLEAGKKILDKETIAKLDEMSDEEIKKAVIKADSAKVDEEKLKDSAYVNARYDHIVENFVESDKQKSDLGKEIIKEKEVKADEYKTPEQIRQENMASYKK
jgi:hypothetical protein